jgi:hypothetical protein
MNNRFATTFAIGIGLIAIIVAGVLYMQRGARVGIAGSILKVRTAALDDNSSVVVLDFRFSNPANVNFVVRSVTVILEEPSGAQYEGQTVSEVDAKRLFELMPLLGQKFNETLLMRDKIPAHTSEDRMVAARFEAPETRLLGRKRFLLRVEDVDGPISEIPENR